jgi:hypothetical protein
MEGNFNNFTLCINSQARTDPVSLKVKYRKNMRKGQCPRTNEKACRKSWIEIQAGYSPECHANIEETVPLAVDVFTRVGGRLQGQEHVVLVGISEHRQV